MKSILRITSEISTASRARDSLARSDMLLTHLDIPVFLITFWTLPNLFVLITATIHIFAQGIIRFMDCVLFAIRALKVFSDSFEFFFMFIHLCFV